MSRLRLNENGRAREIELRGDRLVIGRLEHCDVVVTGQGVSREHAELARAGSGWTIRDLGSSNGTFVNDGRVGAQPLRDGDVIGIGPEVTATFVDDAPATGAPDGIRIERRTTRRGQPPPGVAERRAVERTTSIRRPRETPARPSAPAPPAARPGLPGLFRSVDWRLEPADPGADLVRLRASATTVGRDPGAGLPIEDESVSRMHARLDRSHGHLFVTDLKSRNGTHVNGAPVLREELHDGDRVTFGEVEYLVGRRARLAWERFGVMAGSLLAVVLAIVAVGRVSDALREGAAVRDISERVQRQALESVRGGIAASRTGEADIARTHFLYAADLLLLSDLAPPGTSLSQPQQLFRDIALRLPENEREFDFAKALDPAAVEASAARLASLTNREYVEHQLRRYAAELGQDPNVPPGFVEQVWGFVSGFERHQGWMRTVMGRAREVHPRIRRIVESRHLPEAFCYVAWVESALNPMARSPVGAVGLWQIMPATARELGLRVNPANLSEDERTHPDKSTVAGADYIAKLLREQGPEYFMLVLASYNRGPGAVSRAKQRISDPMLPATRKYWYLVENNLLPEETRNYVPKILAVRLITEAPERFGFEPWR
jgi:pSer/pThr/pTyr-binding forkhead associated (FHA) protein